MHHEEECTIKQQSSRANTELLVPVFHLAINTVLFQKSYKDKCIAFERNLKRGMRMAELYETYVFFKGMYIPADMVINALIMAMHGGICKPIHPSRNHLSCKKTLFSMELGSIMEFLNSKSILVIGATGFLAKSIVSSPKRNSFPPDLRI
ncbi:hypothetical protein SADUNF_Sadunf19G0079800 [Salix dunnii]|uniref:Fatty acyl-CoA reductase n=1 Tax=Salix dunnii TaxID=1413687 RepID=A0A835J4F2_9ROSI|nr:hypothetical protein SADUNF_Sadunf19G0079800 [Salix dunnii]